MKWSKDNTLYIRFPSESNYALAEKGFKEYSPYRDGNRNLFFRFIRGLCFAVRFLPKRIWYNKRILSENPSYILIRDPQITVDYLNWLHEHFPQAQINFTYGNMVGKATHLNPLQIPDYVRVWTYDESDARKYNLAIEPYVINPDLLYKKKTPEYDVFFIGRDKGRGEWLLAFEKQLQELGLKTKFIITKDGRIAKEKSYYQKEISYSEVLEYDKKSRAILNVVMENQEGITSRDTEALALNVKLITTNKHIVEKDLYNPNNVFVLGVREFSEIVDFVMSEPDEIPEELIKTHTFEHRMEVITQDVYPVHTRAENV